MEEWFVEWEYDPKSVRVSIDAVSISLGDDLMMTARIFENQLDIKFGSDCYEHLQHLFFEKIT